MSNAKDANASHTDIEAQRLDLMFTSLPYVSASMAPMAGRIRSCPEDFCVEELPAYAPSGTGEHWFVQVEKRGLTTQLAVRRLAEALALDASQAGWAGLKDRDGVTTQWLSFFCGPKPPALHADFAALNARLLELQHKYTHKDKNTDTQSLRVLQGAFHESKLRTGHLKGNRFVLRFRGVPEDRVEDARAIFEQLCQTGLPNYYGAQRFGRDGDNAEVARQWILGEKKAPRDRFRRKLWVSAFQSAVFNHYVAERMREGTMAHVFEGELLQKKDTGGLFCPRGEEAQRDAQARCDAWLVSPTGPMFGAKMRWPEAESEAREHDLLARAGVAMEHLRRLGRSAPGTRRVIRVRPEDAMFTPITYAANAANTSDVGFTLTFSLPKGSYATALSREFLKDG